MITFYIQDTYMLLGEVTFASNTLPGMGFDVTPAGWEVGIDPFVQLDGTESDTQLGWFIFGDSSTVGSFCQPGRELNAAAEFLGIDFDWNVALLTHPWSNTITEIITAPSGFIGDSIVVDFLYADEDETDYSSTTQFYYDNSDGDN